MTIDQIRAKYQTDAFGGVFLTKNSPDNPKGAKKYYDKRDAMATNKEYQAAKRKWLEEMDKFLDGKIRVQPKMPKIEDFMKK